MVYVLNTKPIHGYRGSVDWGEGEMPSAKYMEAPSDGLPKNGPDKSGVPVDGSMLPKEVIWSLGLPRPPGDLHNSPTMSLSERAKAAIEAVEPDVHHFFPVSFLNSAGELVETRYWFYICNRRDAIHPTKSNMILNRHGLYSPPLDGVDMGWEIPDHVNPDAPAKFVIDETRINGAHLWREARADGLPLMSEAMHQTFIDAGLTGFVPSEKLEITAGTLRRALV